MKLRIIPCLCLGTLLLAARPEADLTKLPLAFEPNRGQADAREQYLARGAGYTIALRPGGAAIATRQDTVQLQFVGAKGLSRPVSEQPLTGKVNYLLGRDRKKWHTDVPTFGAVRYPNVYAGVDVLFYGQQGRLEFDFQVKPGANPGAIRIRLDGAERPRVDAAGDLVAGSLRQHKPVAYQVAAAGRVPVECSYRILRDGEVGLAIGAYDRGRELIIDPVLSYATYVGGSVNDVVMGMKADQAGNLYIAGATTSANFPMRGAAQGTYAGTNSQLLQMQFGDAFVAKLNPSGSALVYSTYLGGSGDDLAMALAIDAAGNAYVAGATQSANFPTTANAPQKTYQGFTANDNNGFYNSGDGFVAKLNPSGNALVYSTYLGGSLNDIALGIAVDANGNAAVVGGTESSNFPTTPNALATQFRGNSNGTDTAAGDAFLTVLNAAGTGYVFSTFLGGSGTDAARGVAIDGQNNIYVTGYTASGNFPTTAGAFQTTFQNAGGSLGGNPLVHAFVSKFSPQGALTYSTLLGGESSDQAAALAVDAAGAVYSRAARTRRGFR